MNESTFSKKNRVEFLSAPSDYSMADEWYELATTDHFWFKWRFEVLKRLMPKNYNWGETLDIGCGNGVTMEQIKKHYGCGVSGCDLNLKALKMIPAEMAPLYFYNIREKQNRLKERFSTILLLDVIEHIKDPVAFLDSVSFHLKPGGSLIVNVPAIQSFFSKYDKVAGHLRRYSTSSLSNELGAAGFQIEQASYWGFTMIPLLFMRKLMLFFCRNNKTIKIGFQPPFPMAHSILNFLGRFECSAFRRVPIGTSLAVLAKKK